MSTEDIRISVPQHTAHLSGYMDAVGRVLTSDLELVSLGVKRLVPEDDLESIAGRVQRRDKVSDWVAEFSKFVTAFLGLDERERLGFYRLSSPCGSSLPVER